MDLKLESVNEELFKQGKELKELKRTYERETNDLTKATREMAIEVNHYRDLYEKSKENMDGWRE